MIAAEGTTILLVEQNGRRAVEIADRTYVMRAGEIVLSGTREEFERGLEIESSYLGFDPLGA
jgi:branched-chain amino acid transport system ATP-binding protein